ncbi:uncharacterized protein LOC143851135 [Tasmannia lanceolata]|uniref:uncharacterized protein LOC143851135 n=1 Tax=Tasmannia lanceolata TaxID=3420 RepID=UPI004064A272
MEPSSKPISLRNIVIRTLFLAIFTLLLRFVYVVTIRTESFNVLTFSGGAIINSTPHSSDSEEDLWTSQEWRKTVDYYSSLFQDLIVEGFLPTFSKALCVGTLIGQEVYALKEIGIVDSVGISKNPYPPLVISGEPQNLPFDDETFDFEFANGVTRLEEFAFEISRTLKPKGFLVIHTSMVNDLNNLNWVLGLFSCCRLILSHEIDGPDSSTSLHQIVMKKEAQIVNKCSVKGYKWELVKKLEPLIAEEPLKPWITLRRNMKNVKYLPSMVNIRFKDRYVYIDVGARSYGSSIGSWFMKQYPKQNRTFEVYAIEADRVFHEEYRKKKGVKLLPYAAWVRNETLFFEINPDQDRVMGNNARGMGRIRPVGSSIFSGNVERIRGFDFANWVMSTVSERDFVVMKMDVEGTEFDLIPRLFETGAICLIDELFLECHYNRWQRCCPGERSSKYEKTYNQCLELFSSLRNSGTLVHQWW